MRQLFGKLGVDFTGIVQNRLHNLPASAADQLVKGTSAVPVLFEIKPSGVD